MKSKSKHLLEQALSTMPQDNALANARFHIRKAIQEIASVEKKRAKRSQQTRSDWGLDLETGMLMSPEVAKLTLGAINDLIGEQQKKLQELKQRKQPIDDSGISGILQD